jgi:UDP-N-acetylenolpyruvoylglucosamine reductase
MYKKYETFSNYNLTYNKEIIKYEPKNIKELIHIKSKKDFFFLKTGSCSYGDKSISNESKNLISLKKFNKIIKIHKKKRIVEAESGISLYDLSMYLYQQGYFLYNVPGGLTVSLGGAIAGNVHGRFSKKNFSNFGDNIKSIKVLDHKNKVIKINRGQKKFNYYVGSFGIEGLILSAELSIAKIDSYNFERIEKLVKNNSDFNDIFNKNENIYGYLNHFKKNSIEGIFFIINKKKKLSKSKFGQFQKYNWPQYLSILSLLVNNLSLKIFYNLIFFVKKFFPNSIKVLSFEKAIYHSSIINLLPYFFQKGMLEIQVSIDKKKFMFFYKNIKQNFIKNEIYPIFCILKKMHVSKKKYFSSFPKNNLSISLGFRKKDYLNKGEIFKKFFLFLKKNNYDVYITKNEIFNRIILENKFLRKIKENKKKSKTKISSIFFETT